MKFIEFHSEKCDECFKCLRFCPTKAIAFTREKRHIVDDLCIKCGQCLVQCKQGALTIYKDTNRVKTMIASHQKVAVSLAPSFAGVFQMNAPGQMATALNQIGFDIVEETARGAEIVSKAYDKVIKSSHMKNIITSCCTSSMYLLQHNYGKSTETAIPVVSPMIAHGRDMKARYGNVYTVFIGPCIAKKAEAAEFDDAIDAVMTFKELEEWFDESNIELSSLDSSSFDTPATKRGRAFPVGGSLDVEGTYKYLHLEGIDECKSFLDAVESDEITGFCAELNICAGGCLNGPEIPLQSPSNFSRMEKLLKYVKKTDSEEVDVEIPEIETKRHFTDMTYVNQTVDENQVYNVLMDMEKYTEQDQINCGACGYSSCYDKAIAVVKGYSDIDMCLDRLKHKVESLQSIIFDNSPNAICILDEEQRIQEINPSFIRIFNEDKIKLDGWPIHAVIGHDIFEVLRLPDKISISQKLYLESVDKTFFINLLKIHDNKTYVGIFTDITYEEQSIEEMNHMKSKTLDTVQEVIENQMRVAQEIASLLGETTAETKIGLNKLRDIVLGEEGR